jgi:tetratricopeptide (TPR) repeat protein
MTAVNHHPQPLGVFPFPAGLLLLPATNAPGADDARDALLRGALPAAWPAEWQFYADAIDGRIDDACAALTGDASTIAAYNRYVLTGDEAGRRVALSDGDDVVQRLTQLAMFVQGASDVLPVADGLPDNVRATILLAAAAHDMEVEQYDAAAAHLTDGISATRSSSPLVAAQLLAQLAQLQPSLDSGSVAVALTSWREAIRLAGTTPLPHLCGDLRVGLALTLHEAAGERRNMLVEAVTLYQEALHNGITLDDTPETYALVQNNIGLAYLTMPMTEAGDKLRHAVAVQAFREALKVYTPETHAESWASTMLNMANAFQHMPTSHPEENLVQAVETYEQLLAVRNKAIDPLGYARLLANQANALAHLGMFQPATEKFTEAHKLLHWHGDPGSAAVILEQLERINAQLVPADASSTAVEGER